MKYLVDTNIIIYHLAGEQKATDFIAQYLHEIAISFISYIEILSYPFDKKQEEDIRKFLEKIHMITISKEIIEEAIRLRKEKKNKLPDCIIAASASVKKLTLVTRNLKDFNSLDLTIHNPF